MEIGRAFCVVTTGLGVVGTGRGGRVRGTLGTGYT